MPEIKRTSRVEVTREFTYVLSDPQFQQFLDLEDYEKDDFLGNEVGELDIEDTFDDEHDVTYTLPKVWAASVEDAFVIEGGTLWFRPNSDVSLGVYGSVGQAALLKWRGIFTEHVNAFYEHLATTSAGDGTPEKSSDDEPIPFVPVKVIEPLTREQLAFYGLVGELAQAMDGMTPPERSRFKNGLRRLHFGHDVDED